MKGGFGDILKQAQQVQEQLGRAQEEIARIEVTGEAGAGLVKVVMNGRHDVRSVSIDPSLAGDELAMLEDLLAAAANDANRRLEAAIRERMSQLTAGMNLPPGFKLPM